MKNADFVRLILGVILCLTLIVKTKEKYNLKKKSIRRLERMNPDAPKIRISVFKILMVNFFTPKNIIIYMALFFNIWCYSSFTKNFLLELEVYNEIGEYVDLHQFAMSQKFNRTLEMLSLYFYAIYSIKFLAYINRVQILMNAFKKASFEYFSIIAMISLLLISSAFLMNNIYGKSIYEYSTFSESLIMNIKIFVFIENTSITIALVQYSKLYSIVILVLFVFLIKYFALNLVLPVLVEYYRSEYENSENSQINKKKNDDEDDHPLTIKQSKYFLTL